jgi:hypothetical protein
MDDCTKCFGVKTVNEIPPPGSPTAIHILINKTKTSQKSLKIPKWYS